MAVDIRICETDFDTGAEYLQQRARTGGKAGAIATFVGLVRDRHHEEHHGEDGAGGESVSMLELEHYPGMTEQSIAVIVGEAEQRWPLLDVVVLHRVGQMQAGDQIVLVQVASAHRAAAFAACEFLMDYLKTEAVFWKREVRTSGQHWIESTREDHERREGWQVNG